MLRQTFRPSAGCDNIHVGNCRRLPNLPMRSALKQPKTPFMAGSLQAVQWKSTISLLNSLVQLVVFNSTAQHLVSQHMIVPLAHCLTRSQSAACML